MWGSEKASSGSGSAAEEGKVGVLLPQPAPGTRPVPEEEWPSWNRRWAAGPAWAFRLQSALPGPVPLGQSLWLGAW